MVKRAVRVESKYQLKRMTPFEKHSQLISEFWDLKTLTRSHLVYTDESIEKGKELAMVSRTISQQVKSPFCLADQPEKTLILPLDDSIAVDKWSITCAGCVILKTETRRI